MPLSCLLADDLQNGVFKEPARVGAGLKLINVYDLYGDTAVNLDSVEMFQATEEEAQRYAVCAGDVFFTRSSLKPEGVAWTAYVDEVAEPAVFECHLIRARVKKDRIVPAYLSNYCRTTLPRLYLMARAGVTTMATIDQPAVLDLPVVVPSLPSQQHMVAELEQARQLRQRKLDQADAMLLGLEAFILDRLGLALPCLSKSCFATKARQIDGPINPERYRALVMESGIEGTTVERVAEIIEDRITPSAAGPDSEWDWIRIDDLQNEPIEVETRRTAPGRSIDGTFFPVTENDVLVARLGPTVLNRKFVLCPKIHRPTVASSEFLVLRCRAGWNPLVVLWTLRTSLYRDLIYSKGRGATPSRYRVNRDDFAKLPFPLIGGDVQDELAAAISQRLKDAVRLREEAAREWEAARAAFEARLLGESVE